MTTANKSNLQATFTALGAFALFASHDVVVKILGGSYATFQIIFFSVLLSFPLVVLMLMRDPRQATLIPVHPWWSALRTASAIIAGSCAFYAFSTLPLAQVYTILFATPLVITLLSIPILKEKVGIHRWFAIALGLIGVLIVLRPGSEPVSLGHLAAITAAVFGALASVVVRKIGRDERSAVLLLYPMMANFVVMAMLLPFVYVPMPIEHLGLVAVMAVFSFVAGLMLIAAYTKGDAAAVAPMQYSQIVWAAAYGMFFFAETPDRITWIGAGVVISSGLYIVAREVFGGTTLASPVLLSRLRPETATSPRLGALWWKKNRGATLASEDQPPAADTTAPPNPKDFAL